MRAVISIFIPTFFLSFTSQIDLQEGIYKYEKGFFYESIELNKDHKFNYDYRSHSISFSLEGSYIVKGDNLILNSNPQRDKILVKESKKGNKSNIRFFVTDKSGNPFNYTLYVINKKNDTVILRNQWEASKLKNSTVKDFYIIDSKGLKTPLYQVKGTRANYFQVQMERKRVLDNEIWKIKGDSIIPIGMDGKYQLYVLKK